MATFLHEETAEELERHGDNLIVIVATHGVFKHSHLIPADKRHLQAKHAHHHYIHDKKSRHHTPEAPTLTGAKRKKSPEAKHQHEAIAFAASTLALAPWLIKSKLVFLTATALVKLTNDLLAQDPEERDKARHDLGLPPEPPPKYNDLMLWVVGAGWYDLTVLHPRPKAAKDREWLGGMKATNKIGPAPKILVIAMPAPVSDISGPA